MKVIEEAPTPKWTPGAERQLVLNMAGQLQDQLKRSFPEIRIGSPWPGKDGYVLATHKTNVTMWLSLRFTPDEQPPYEPKGWRTESGFTLMLVGELKLSGAGRRQAPLREQWDQMTEGKKLCVPVFDAMTKGSNGWMRAEREILGTAEEIVTLAAEAGSGLLQVVKRFA
jgi:hypothetical protein